MQKDKFKSPNFNGKIFLNPVPTDVLKPGKQWEVFTRFFQPNTAAHPPSKLSFDSGLKAFMVANDPVKVIWLGHSTLLIGIEGKLILTDPVWYQRVSPYSFMGPKRFFDVPVKLDELPALDAVIVSHNHYDHFDNETLRYLGSKGNKFYCPVGVGHQLMALGIKDENLFEFDWWDELQVSDELTFAATPARHFSGRSLTDRFHTLWASWVIKGRENRIFFGADSGMFPGFKTIGDQYGPFDLTMLEIGAYNLEAWPDIHMGPENAIEAHLMLKGKVLLPIHWGTFNLALHPWREPAELAIEAARQKNVSLLMPVPGAYCSPSYPVISEWWNNIGQYALKPHS